MPETLISYRQIAGGGFLLEFSAITRLHGGDFVLHWLLTATIPQEQFQQFFNEFDGHEGYIVEPF